MQVDDFALNETVESSIGVRLSGNSEISTKESPQDRRFSQGRPIQISRPSKYSKGISKERAS